MWAGLYMLDFEQYMVDLKQFIPADIVAGTTGANYFSKGGDINNALYVAPMTVQWYTGWYNKKLFADAGITDVPQTWDELNAAAEKLKAAGIQPIIQGAAGGSAQFQPLFEWAYHRRGAAGLRLGQDPLGRDALQQPDARRAARQVARALCRPAT